MNNKIEKIKKIELNNKIKSNKLSEDLVLQKVR